MSYLSDMAAATSTPLPGAKYRRAGGGLIALKLLQISQPKTFNQCQGRKCINKQIVVPQVKIWSARTFGPVCCSPFFVPNHTFGMCIGLCNVMTPGDEQKTDGPTF
jgi:hypothetical protein